MIVYRAIDRSQLRAAAPTLKQNLIWSVYRYLNLQSDSPIVRIDSGDKTVQASTWPAAVLVCSGRSVFELLEHAVAKAASLSGAARPRTEKQLPDSINYFGWCTWDAFYSSVSAQVCACALASDSCSFGAAGTVLFRLDLHDTCSLLLWSSFVVPCTC